MLAGPSREPVWPATSADLVLRAGLLAVLAASFVCVTFRLGGSPPPSSGSTLGTFAFAAYGSVAVHFAFRVGLTKWLGRALVFALIGAVIFAALNTGSVVVLLKSVLVAIGAAGFASYVRAAIVRTGQERIAALADLAEALMVPLAIAQVTFYLWLEISRNPIYDAFIYDFERRLAVPFEQIVAVTFRSGMVRWPSIACYLALPIGAAAVAGALRARNAGLRLVVAAITAGVLGFLLYRIAPATGPRDAFTVIDLHNLPGRASGVLAPIWTPGTVPRNAMPSLHAVWALLLVFGAAPLGRRWRLAAIGFAALNIWAAIGRYQHWFMDIIVAVPLAVAVYCVLISRGPASRRIPAAAISFVVCVGWLVAFRRGSLTSLGTTTGWLIVTATMVISAIVGRWAGRSSSAL